MSCRDHDLDSQGAQVLGVFYDLMPDPASGGLAEDGETVLKCLSALGGVSVVTPETQESRAE
jgi:hypothetical protein